jgi:hypothetical protein
LVVFTTIIKIFFYNYHLLIFNATQIVTLSNAYYSKIIFFLLNYLNYEERIDLDL